MAAQPIPIPDDLATRPLGPKDGPATWRLLSDSGVKDVFIASQVWRGALEQRGADGMPELFGVFAAEELRAVLFLGLGGLAVPAGAERHEVATLGPVLARRAASLRALIGGLENVDALWPFVENAGARARINVRDLFLEADERSLDPEAREPELRLATLDDLDLVTRASSRAHLEEMGDDPLVRNPEVFLGRMARMILEERVFVVRQGDTLVFKAELSALCPVGGQIAGVYTDPEHRGRGMARRGTGEVAWRTLAGAPAMCLFVREDNPAALRAYERAGFRHTCDYRTLLLEDPTTPEGPREARALPVSK